MSAKDNQVSRDTTIRAQVESDILGEVLDTFEGRRVIYNLLAKAEIYGDYPLDPVLTDRLIGRRGMGLEVLQDILTVRPNVYIIMQQEAEVFEAKYTTPTLTEEEREDD